VACYIVFVLLIYIVLVINTSELCIKEFERLQYIHGRIESMNFWHPCNVCCHIIVHYYYLYDLALECLFIIVIIRASLLMNVICLAVMHNVHV